MIKLKDALLKMNWKLHHNVTKTHHKAASSETGRPPHTIHRGSHSWQKQFSLLTWLLGWRVYMNLKNIRKIKQNLQLLQTQNDLQESQIVGLAHYLNLRMIQVQEHHGVFSELDIKLLVSNNPLAETTEAMNYLIYLTTLITDIHTKVTRLTVCVLSLKEGVELFYEYM